MNVPDADFSHSDKKLSGIFEKTNTKLSLLGKIDFFFLFFFFCLEKIDILTSKWESSCFSEGTSVMERIFWKHS